MSPPVDQWKDSLCAGCGQCCYGTQNRIPVLDDELARYWIAYGRPGTLADFKAAVTLEDWDGDQILDFGGGRCPFLERRQGAWRCQVFEVGRPLTCVLFECGAMVAVSAGHLALDTAAAGLARQEVEEIRTADADPRLARGALRGFAAAGDAPSLVESALAGARRPGVRREPPEPDR
jgi:Fe-S-cluster containining protein